jgi:hypothetical protein
MARFLICSNSKCHLVLDRYVNGRSLNGLSTSLPTCPSCGGSWSSTCPSCGHALAVRLDAERPRRICCAAKRKAEESAEQPPLTLPARLEA